MKQLTLVSGCIQVLFACDIIGLINGRLVNSCAQSYRGVSVSELHSISVWQVHGYIPSEAFYQNPFYLPYKAPCLKLKIELKYRDLFITFQYFNKSNMEDKAASTCIVFTINQGAYESNLIIPPIFKRGAKCHHSWKGVQEVIGDFQNYLFIFGCDSYNNDLHYNGLWILRAMGKNISDAFMDKQIDTHYKHMRKEGIIYVNSSETCDSEIICENQFRGDCSKEKEEIDKLKKSNKFVAIAMGMGTFVVLILIIVLRYCTIKKNEINE